jgi:hypothetical protein
MPEGQQKSILCGILLPFLFFRTYMGEPQGKKVIENRKSQWTGVENQAPDPKLEIFKPGNTEKITYSADLNAGAYSKLLSYAFSEAADDLEGSFSFSVENDEVRQDGKTVFDIIPIRSVVKIYEGDLEKPVFVGIIRRRRMGAVMTSQGVKRTITFAGKSIISCVAEYAVSLDVRIQGVQDAVSKTKSLAEKLAHDGVTIKEFMKASWEHFKEVSETAGISTAGIAAIIDNFIGSFDEFVTVSGENQALFYNIATPFYNESNNFIADIWRHILPKPVYEISSYCGGGGPKIIARQVPFSGPDWKNLNAYLISPVSLVSYDLNQSDEDVYTAFMSYVIGSARDRNFYMAVNNTGNDDIAVHDRAKQKIYGFKPLEISFSGYDRQGNTRNKDADSLKEALKKLNELASYWYSRLDEMYSGTITICTDFNNPETNPRAGHRAKFMGGEFYIERADHAWNFGGAPTIRLSVSRGMVYGDDGKMKGGEAGIIKNVGGRFRELEEDNA